MMKVEIRQTKISRAEIDPMAVVKAFPVEWAEFLGDATQTGGWDDEDIKEFVTESLHECGADIFDEIEAQVEEDDETEIDIR